MRAKTPATDITYKLYRWGEWCRKRQEGLSFPHETGLYRAMAGHVRLNVSWRTNGFNEDDYFLDTDMRVAALPDDMKRAVFAEFVVAGDVRTKTAAAGMPTSTYCRTLKRAKWMLADASRSVQRF